MASSMNLDLANQLDSLVSSESPNKEDMDGNSSPLIPMTEDSPTSVDLLPHRKIFAHHVQQHKLSGVGVKVTGSKPFTESGNGIYNGNRIPQSTLNESFISSQSSDLHAPSNFLPSDVDHSQSSTSPEDHLNMALKEAKNGFELKQSLSILASSRNIQPSSNSLQTMIPSSIARFQIDNRIDENFTAVDRMLVNHQNEEPFETDTTTSSKRTNLTFSVENILAPNKFGQIGIKEYDSQDSKEHTDDEEDHGRAYSHLV